MINEVLFITIVILDFIYIIFSTRFGRESVIIAIIINILLVSTFGGKLITLFGYETNAGNTFYALVFFGMNILIAYYGKNIAYKTIWLGLSALIFYVIMGQFVIRLQSVPGTFLLSKAMETVFLNVPRIAFASMIAYLFAQHINFYVFSLLYEGKKPLWISNMISVFFSQSVDSVIFFSLAFLGTIAFPLFLQTLLVGFLLKLCIGLLSSPFFSIAQTIIE